MTGYGLAETGNFSIGAIYRKVLMIARAIPMTTIKTKRKTMIGLTMFFALGEWGRVDFFCLAACFFRAGL